MRRWTLAKAGIAPLVVLQMGVGLAPAEAATADVQPRPLAWIAPGTVIGSGAPKGWSHLILYANPRIAAGDVNAVPRTAAQFVDMFHFTILANVKPERPGGPNGYYLDQVAIGSAAEVGGRNVIITTDQTFGFDLGFIGRRVLQENERILQKDVQQVVRTRTMLVFDAKGYVLYNGKHAQLVIRHAILCDPADGSVRTLIWLLGASSAGGYAPAEADLQVLPPDLHEDRQLHVEGNKFTLGVPSNDAFALNRIAQGTPIHWTRDLADAASTARFTTEAAHRLEAELRGACDAAGLAGRPPATDSARR